MKRKKSKKWRPKSPQPVAKAVVRKRRPEDPRRMFMKQRLAEWGRWRRSWHVGPKRVRSWWGSAILARFVGLGGTVDDARPIDEDAAHETDNIVRGLDEQLLAILLVQYVLGGEKADKAKASGLSERGFYYALGRALDAFEIRATVMMDRSTREKIIREPTWELHSMLK